MVDPSVALRAGGGACVLVAGAVGVGLPFMMDLRGRSSRALLYTKAAAAGVVLSLALVHLINECFSTFAEMTPGAHAAHAARAARRAAARPGGARAAAR
jgi:hypothetical protein